ncbi:class I SAM-dependent methyltransferase [Leptothermofonsia sp. ETS-13]|uniref:class I SAM-dependent methyltransferase n=1 Tax=Leptothermofonsia sp. ETS-13 TaxID=3035696 RepID=UPI003BA04F41
MSEPEENQPERICVDLGCGDHKSPGFIGVDIYPGPEVDIVADLNQQFPFPDNSVDLLKAYDSIEHLSDRLHTMNEIWRICKPDGIVDIRVPSTDGRGAFQDPTHISFWNINSFKYYCVEFPSYLALCQRYGFKGAFSIIELNHEDETQDHVIHVRAILKAIKSDGFLIDDLEKRLRLRATNLIIFPDWSQLGEQLYEYLSEVIRAIAQHPDRQSMTLLVEKGNFPEQAEISLEEVFYELVLNLFLTEGIDIANEGPEVSLLENLAPHEYEKLFQSISYRISIPFEDREIVEFFQAESLPICDLETLKQSGEIA